MQGFTFPADKPPDGKLFRRLSAADDIWVPKAACSADSRKLQAKFRRLRGDAMSRICALLAYDRQLPDRWRTPRIVRVGKSIYIHTEDNAELEGCRPVECRCAAAVDVFEESHR